MSNHQLKDLSLSKDGSSGTEQAAKSIDHTIMRPNGINSKGLGRTFLISIGEDSFVLMIDDCVRLSFDAVVTLLL